MTTPIPLPNDEQLIWQGQPGRTTLPAAKATICVLTALLLALAVAAAHLLAPSPSLGDGLAEVCSLIRMPFSSPQPSSSTPTSSATSSAAGSTSSPTSA